MINSNSKIYVAGHRGLVGSAILKKLIQKRYKNIIVVDRKNLDLTNQSKVLLFLKKKKPDFIFIAAAKVGGIYSNNNYKAEFIQENLSIQTNLIHSAYLSLKLPLDVSSLLTCFVFFVCSDIFFLFFCY